MSLPRTEEGTPTERPPSRSERDDSIRVTCIDYAPDRVQAQDVADVEEFLARHRPAWSRVRWISVHGLGHPGVIQALASKHELHPLAVEDVLHRVQRAKVEDYPASEGHPGRLFVVVRTIGLHDEELRSDQVDFFLGRTTLLTFQDDDSALFEPIRKRIQSSGSRLRENDASFLLYALVDAVVDSYFPLLEEYSDRLEHLEEEILAHPERDTLASAHSLKRDLLLIRRAAWPMQDLIQQLQRDKHECLSDTTQTYFRDVYDHCLRIIDLIETYRESTNALVETYMSVISHRTSEIMRVLTVIGTIFIPLTFLTGVYGMNLSIPESRWSGTYPLFWAVSLAIIAGMLLWFKRRGWL